MRLRPIATIAATVAMFAAPTMAQAAWGEATGWVNMRTCASVQCAKIGVVPEGARVWIKGTDRGWYNVRFDGKDGYVSGRYVEAGYVRRGPDRPHYRPGFRPPPPRHGYHRRPWWDDRHRAWHDGDRWYFNGRWYDRPSGFSFGFGFGS